MTEVIFSNYTIKTVTEGVEKLIFDIVRKRYVPLTPEEWVRQHILHYLIFDMKYPKSLIAVERGFEVNGLKKRFDILVFDRESRPVMIVECKADTQTLDENVFKQIAVYNNAWKVKYLWVTNGGTNFCCRLGDSMQMLSHIPTYSEL